MTIYEEIEKEVQHQKSKSWKDEKNTAGLFSSYICNYATRWSMPASFDAVKYGFRQCMIKTAALAVSAIEAYDNKYLNDLDLPNQVSEENI